MELVCKKEFVENAFTAMLKALNSQIHSCTYNNDKGLETVTIWLDVYDVPSLGTKINVTGDSIPQLIVDVINKYIL